MMPGECSGGTVVMQVATVMQEEEHDSDGSAEENEVRIEKAFFW